MTFCNEKFRGMLFAACGALVLEFLMTFTDTVVAGMIVGEKGIAGVNLVMPAIQVMLAVTTAISLGTSILHGSSMSRFDGEGAARIFSCGFVASVGGGMIFALLMLFSSELILSLFNADPEVYAHARSYWLWYALTAVIAPLQFFLVNLVYADGDRRTCSIAYPVHFIANIGFSYLCCRLWGVGGCAMGTFIAHVLSVFVLALHWRRPGNSLLFRNYFSFKDVVRMIMASAGEAGVMLSMAIVSIVLNAFAGACFGASALTVTAVAAATIGLSQLFDGVSFATQPFIEVYAGEGNTVRVRTLMRTALRAEIIFGTVLAAVLVIWPELMLKMVSVADPKVVPEARFAVRMIALSFVVWAPIQLLNSYYLFIERPLLSLLLTAICGLVLPVILLVLGGWFFNAHGMWIGYALSLPIGLALFLLYLGKRYGWKMLPLMMPPERDQLIRVWDIELEPHSICEVSQAIGEEAGMRAALLTEEVFMAIRDKNGSKRVLAEATLDRNDGISLVFRDDGKIFDITDTDAKISSLRAHLVSSMMALQPHRRNLTTTGFNRNAFRF